MTSYLPLLLLACSAVAAVLSEAPAPAEQAVEKRDVYGNQLKLNWEQNPDGEYRNNYRDDDDNDNYSDSDRDVDNYSDDDETTTSVFRCRRKRNGWYSQGRCRNVYYRCWKKHGYRHHCPSKHVFHGRHKRCMPKLMVRECRIRRKHHKSYETKESSSSESDERRRYYVERESKEYRNRNQHLRIQIRKKDEDSDNFETVRVFQCKGQADGFYHHGRCHNHYFRCTNGQSFRQNCPHGHIFHHAHRRCVPRLKVKHCIKRHHSGR